MSKTLDDDAGALGLSEAMAGEPVALPLPALRQGQGLVAQPPCSLHSLLADGLEQTRFLHVRLRALQQVGLCLYAHEHSRRVWKLSAIDGHALEVIGRPLAALHDSDDPGTVLLELGDERVAVVSDADRCGVIIEADASALRQVFLPLADEAFEPLQSQAAAWAGTDEWLAQSVRERLGSNDPIGHAIAAGLVKRLWAPAAPASGLVARMLAGEPVQELRRAHDWMRSLASAQRRGIERLACERAKKLQARMGAGGPLTVEMLRERDDLEGVRLLLREAGAGQRLDRVAHEVDRAGRSMPLPAGCGVVEQLSRARRLDPGAWWVAGNDA